MLLRRVIVGAAVGYAANRCMDVATSWFYEQQSDESKAREEEVFPGGAIMNAALASGCGSPLNTYGFSTGFTSIASPYACADHCAGPDATASRQLNAEVLSASIDAGSLPWY